MSQGSTSIGRLPVNTKTGQVNGGQPVLYDAPEKVISALLSQNDALIAVIQAMAAQLDAATVSGHPYTTAAVSALAPIALTE